MSRPRLLRKSLLYGLSLLLLLGVSLGLLWQYGPLKSQVQKWFQKRVLERSITELQKHLPFRIEQVEVDFSWEDFRQGKISELSLILRHGDLRAHLRGPVELSLLSESEEWSVRYRPLSRFELKGQASSELHLELWAKIPRSLSRDWTQVSELGLKSGPDRFEWKALGAELARPRLFLAWREGRTRIELKANSAQWSSEAKTLLVDHPELSLQAPMTLTPFNAGPEIELRWNAQGAEAMVGEHYFDLPLRHLGTRIKATITDLPRNPIPSRLSVEIGQVRNKPAFQLGFDVEAREKIQARWKSAALSIPDLLAGIPAQYRPAALSEIQLQKGNIQTQGMLELPEPFRNLDRAPSDLLRALWLEGRVDISGLQAWNRGWAMSGGALAIPLRSQGRSEGRVAAETLYLKRLKGKLPPTPIQLDWDLRGATPSVSFELPEGLAPRFPAIPVSLGKTQGALRPGAWELLSSLRIPRFELKQLTEPFCLGKKPVPPLSIEANLDEIRANASAIETRGSILARLFEGTIEINQIAAADLDTVVPEFRFESRWGGIRLDRLGEWLKFGKMDGVLQGHARDVVFQSWMPTRFDFLLEGKPHRKNDIVFSPDAMANFMYTVAGIKPEELPGYSRIARWFMFGWPKRVTGGYDLYYAGVKLKSQDGLIQLETLDQKKFFSEEDHRQDRHFILNGFSFKMPINSRRYPVIMDSTATGNLARKMFLRLSSIAQSESKDSETRSELDDLEKEKQENDQDELCLPPQF